MAIAVRASDVTIWNETELPKKLKKKPKLGDKAYQGADKPIVTPKKNPKGGELTPPEKESNKQISQERIYVEHSIRKIKGFRIVRDEYRLVQGIFPMIVAVVVGLLQFSDLMN